MEIPPIPLQRQLRVYWYRLFGMQHPVKWALYGHYSQRSIGMSNRDRRRHSRPIRDIEHHLRMLQRSPRFLPFDPVCSIFTCRVSAERDFAAVGIAA